MSEGVQRRNQHGEMEIKLIVVGRERKFFFPALIFSPILVPKYKDNKYMS